MTTFNNALLARGLPQKLGGVIAGSWFMSPVAPLIAGTAPGAGSIRLFPIPIPEACTITALAARVTTVSAGGNFQLALYATNYATLRATGAALASTGSLSTASLAFVSGAVNVQVQPGIYWIGLNCDNGTAAFTGGNSNSSYVGTLVGSPSSTNILGTNSSLTGFAVSQAFGTWPDITAASQTEIVAATIPVALPFVGSVP